MRSADPSSPKVGVVMAYANVFSELCAASPGVEAKCGGCKLAISVLRLDRTSGLMLEATPTQCAQEAK